MRNRPLVHVAALPPSGGMEKITAGIAWIPTGVAVVGVGLAGLRYLSLARRGEEAARWEEFVESQATTVIERDDDLAGDWAARVIAGDPAVPVDMRGSSFQLKVWQVVRGIPLGGTRTYGGIARLIGRPDACRAVGTAVGRNAIAIAVPCHRVVPASGGCGNYRWGRMIKQQLLEMEARS